MKKFIAIMLVFVLAMLSGCVSVSNPPSIVEGGGNESATTTEPPTEAVPLAEQMEVTEYFINRSVYDLYCHYVLFIKNNSDVNVILEANATAKGADGAMVGASSDSSDPVAPGQTTCISMAFDNPEDIESCEYILMAKEAEYNLPTEGVTVEYNILPEKVIFSATNNGTVDAEFVHVDVVFLKEGTPVDYDYCYIVNDESNLPAGATLTSEVRCSADEGFDDIVYAVSGRMISF